MTRARTGKFRARSLRLRLTLIYVVFLIGLLSLIGFSVRQSLRRVLHNQIIAMVEDEFGAVKSFLRFENGRPTWFYDRRDPEESWTVDRLRRVLLVSDADGNPIEISTAYHLLGVDPPEELRAIAASGQVVWKTRYSASGVPFFVRLGVLKEGGRNWVIGVGRSLSESQGVVAQFTRFYLALFPLIVGLGGAISWFLAGRALGPVNDLAATAQGVSGSSLKVRIPTRGAGDELDDLITAFNQMMDRLEQSFQQSRQFSTDVSHELRTPLTTLRGQLEVALMTARGEEQFRDAILAALQDVERVSQVVRALLQLAQAESGQLALQRSSCNAAAVIREVIDQFQLPAAEAGIQLTASTPNELVASIDRVQFERLVTNLLTNALKYTASGGRIDASVAEIGDSLVLRVEDSGKGIPPEHLPHVFNRFFRVPQSYSEYNKGLGLGLSFVAWIVKAHGGHVDVASAPGKGSVFTVTLPLGTRTRALVRPGAALQHS